MLEVTFSLAGLFLMLIGIGDVAISGQIAGLNDSTVRPIPAAKK